MHHIKPTITKQNGRQSEGKGFSPNELKEAGINKQQAKQMCLPVDLKRKSTHKENVDCIKAHAQKTETKPKPQKAKFAVKEKS